MNRRQPANKPKLKYHAFFNFKFIDGVKHGLCKICGTTIKMTNANTKGIMMHLARKHRSKYEHFFPPAIQFKQEQLTVEEQHETNKDLDSLFVEVPTEEVHLPSKYERYFQFEIIDGIKYGNCMLCESPKSIKMLQSSTKGLIIHLTNKHPAEYREFTQENKSNALQTDDEGLQATKYEKYFRFEMRDGIEFGCCLLCKSAKPIKMLNSSTSGLNVHLISRHPREYREFNQENKQSNKCRSEEVHVTSKYEQYFRFEMIEGVKFGFCLLCELANPIKMLNANTRGISLHFSSKHPNEYRQFTEYERNNLNVIEKSRSLTRSLTSSRTSQHTFASGSTEPTSSTKTKTTSLELTDFDKALLQFISEKCLAFDFFTDRASKTFFNFLNEDYIQPTVGELRQKVLGWYLEKQAELVRLVKKVESKLSFSINGSIQVCNKTFYCITVHFIDDFWHLQSIVLDFYGGETLAHFFYYFLAKNLLLDKLQAVTYDQTIANSTFLTDFRDLVPNWYQNFCFTDLLRFGIEDVLLLMQFGPIEKLKTIFHAIEANQDLFTYFTNYCQRLNVDGWKMPKLVELNWLGYVSLMASGLKVRQVIESLQNQVVQLQSQEWSALELAYEYLNEFKPLSLVLLAQDYAILPLLVRDFQVLLERVDLMLEDKNQPNCDQNLILAIRNSRTKMLNHYNKFNPIHYYITLVLDPRQVPESTYSKELKTQCYEMFQQVYKDHYLHLNPQLQDPLEVELREEAQAEGNEIEAYEKCKRQTQTEILLNWWKRHQEQFPSLAAMAKDFLAIPGNSLQAERTFLGCEDGDKFKMLDLESAQAVLCLNSWLKS